MTREARFAFGENWQSFLVELDEDRIDQAVTSLQQLLGLETLEGKRFMDLGCGEWFVFSCSTAFGSRSHFDRL